jgi:hypothetical protein
MRSDWLASKPTGKPAKAAQAGPSRRLVISGAATLLAFSGAAGSCHAASEPTLLNFAELYEGSGVLGLKFTAKLASLEGKRAMMRGFMAPPLKAESHFFVLTREPVTICPFCSSDAEWPTDIVVIYLKTAAAPTKFSELIQISGILEIGSKSDAETGFVSQIRLVDAEFAKG